MKLLTCIKGLGNKALNSTFLISYVYYRFMRLLRQLLFYTGSFCLSRFFSVVAVFAPNNKVKAVHFGYDEESLKQSIIEMYFQILKEDPK